MNRGQGGFFHRIKFRAKVVFCALTSEGVLENYIFYTIKNPPFYTKMADDPKTRLLLLIYK
ncbi:hypothetical protein GCM10009117_08750 [Gangjinia marincola]|uniref:Ribosomal protein L33 n=1 Tax=Gangjinia marincola TaxID=578463 RepID=A0ABN1MF25_9FLAO